MIYTPDWERLARALERVASAHGDLEESKAAICNAIADKKIAVRVTVGRSHRHSGMTFASRNVGVPVRLNPDDFDWTQSRPLAPWRIGPQPGEHYTWIGGWQPEPISLIELRAKHVTKVLLGHNREVDASIISRAQATQLVGMARFAGDWVGRLTRRERYLLDRHGLGPGPQPGTLHQAAYDPFAEINEGEEHTETEGARSRHWLMQWQRAWVGKWQKERGFTGPKFARAKFEMELIEAFPWKVNDVAPISWSPPGQLTASRLLIELSNEPTIWLSNAVNLMAFGNENAPKERHLIECAFRRRQATTVLFEAARRDIVRLIGSPDVERDHSDPIPPRYFDIPRNLGDPDNCITTDLDRASDAAFSAAFDGKHQKWFNVRVDGPSFVAWLRSRVSPSHTDEHAAKSLATRRQPSRDRAKRALADIYSDNIPDQAVEPNSILCRKVGAWLKKYNLAEVKDDTILRAAGRRK
jgi:hypothetical protein